MAIMATRLYTHPACLEHDMGAGHPERPARLEAILTALQAPEFAALEWHEAPRASIDQIARAHPRGFVEALLEAVPRGGPGDAGWRYLALARLRRGGAPGGGRRLRRRRCGCRRRGRQCLLRRAPAGPPCRAGDGHGILPVQQRRRGRPSGAQRPWPQANRGDGFRRASRQRDPGHVRAGSRALLRLDPSDAPLSRNGIGGRDRLRQYLQCPAAAQCRLGGVPRRHEPAGAAGAGGVSPRTCC